MRLEGIHHISAITGDAARNVDFYARVLGLRLVAKTVNQDDPRVYHLFYADERGRPGAEMTFFEYPRAIPGARARAWSTPSSGGWATATRSRSGRRGCGPRASPPSAPTRIACASPIPRACITS